MESKYIYIPYKIMSDKKISNFSKILFGTLYGLSRQEGYCWATNSFLGKLLCKSNRTITKSIAELFKNNYIYVDYKDAKMYSSGRKIFINQSHIEVNPIVDIDSIFNQ